MKLRPINEQTVMALYDEYIENWYDDAGNEVVNPVVITDYTPDEIVLVKRLFGDLFGNCDIDWLRGLESKPFS